MPNATKPNLNQSKFVDNGETHSIKNGTETLEQRVYEFDKTAKYMIKKLTATRESIEKCTEGPAAVENFKLTIAPDAATLISQGDTLVLETHGKSPDLSNTVMHTQSMLREKFREMKHAQ